MTQNVTSWKGTKENRVTIVKKKLISRRPSQQKAPCFLFTIPRGDVFCNVQLIQLSPDLLVLVVAGFRLSAWRFSRYGDVTKDDLQVTIIYTCREDALGCCDDLE